MREIKLDVDTENIEEISRIAKQLARKHKARVCFTFNDVNLFATRKKSPVTIVWEYLLALSQHESAYEASAQYRKDCAEQEAKTRSFQETMDVQLTLLPDVLKSGLDNTIGWLANFTRMADRVGTNYDRQMLAEMLEAHGYKENEFVGKEKEFFLIKENLGRCIIGHVIELLKNKVSPYPYASRYYEEYEAMRGGKSPI